MSAAAVCYDRSTSDSGHKCHLADPASFPPEALTELSRLLSVISIAAKIVAGVGTRSAGQDGAREGLRVPGHSVADSATQRAHRRPKVHAGHAAV
jgi:hypothetical protein